MESALLDVEQPGRTTLRLVLGAPLVIGRDCDGLLVDDDEVSRRHVEFRLTSKGVQVTDLGSTNGTTVGDVPLVGSTAVEPGVPIRFGAVVVRVVTEDRTLARRPAMSTLAGVGRQTSIDRVAASLDLGPPVVVDDGHRQGTITIVFSDIEGSTELTSSVGDAEWFRVLERHNGIVRDEVRRFGGTEVKNQGDGFMLTFPSARRALQAMSAVQHRLRGHTLRVGDRDLRVRMGLHTGEAIVDDDGDLFGHHVNLAARVAGAANGEEILVSSLTRAILETRDDIAFGESRSVELKGIAGVHQVHPVLWRDDAGSVAAT